MFFTIKIKKEVEGKGFAFLKDANACVKRSSSHQSLFNFSRRMNWKLLSTFNSNSSIKTFRNIVKNVVVHTL
ncbi:MAG: hypothetical protein DRO89_06520 [Candidatus Altiarchaeales archaeon]|nr:MAG: hypothetical protein DRO89_06520 [Candidatus Altiarchaeales archaeon]